MTAVTVVLCFLMHSARDDVSRPTNELSALEYVIYHSWPTRSVAIIVAIIVAQQAILATR